MQEHINAAQVIGCNIDLLTVKSVADRIFAKNFLCFQKQRTRATCGIIYFINFCFSYRSKPCKQF